MEGLTAADPQTVGEFRISNQDELWNASVNGAGTADTGLVVSDGALYVSTGLALQALGAKTGDAIWSYTPTGGATGALYSTPVIAGGLLYIGSSNENLYAIRI